MPLILDGRVAAMLTWTEAINLGASLFVFGYGAGAQVDAHPALVSSTVEDAVFAAGKAHAEALAMIRLARGDDS